ncbi:hypothetical protein [Paraliobacillus sp. JSM ZJ581]|uniref:hypothetical protein n=1 Tax=Paraliobacillus sp. JSM ZJ581 TaxID=3342118 RepID=UPI0035A92BEE
MSVYQTLLMIKLSIRSSNPEMINMNALSFRKPNFKEEDATRLKFVDLDEESQKELTNNFIEKVNTEIINDTYLGIVGLII